jgi:hypothetical protein
MAYGNVIICILLIADRVTYGNVIICIEPGSLHAARCTLYAVRLHWLLLVCTLHSALCTLHAARCTLYAVRLHRLLLVCTLHSALCTVVREPSE